MFMKFIGELIEFIVIVWLVRFVLRNLLGTSRRQTPPFQPNNAASASAPTEKVGEMKKDPQCGTYVSTELSLKVRSGGEVLHFCSSQCQDAYLQAHSGTQA